MIALFQYKSLMGSQYSVRAGNEAELAYQIFFRDGLKMLLDQGLNARSKKVRSQFEYAESVYQAQCNNSITLEMIKTYNFSTDIGGFACLASAEEATEIDTLIETILAITEKRRMVNARTEETVQNVIDLLNKAKNGETAEIVEAINDVHHIL